MYNVGCLEIYTFNNPTKISYLESKIFKRGKRRLKTILDTKCEECKEHIYKHTSHPGVESKKIYHFCSVDCVNISLKSGTLNKKFEQTNFSRYGVLYPQQSQAIKNKTMETNIKNCGYPWLFQSPIIQQQVKETCFDKYGVGNPMQCEEIQEKVKTTNMFNHGVEHTFQREDVKEKIIETCFQIYGVEHPAQSEICKQKTIETNMEKYGCEYPMQTKEVHDKLKNTMEKNHGVEFALQKEEFLIQQRNTMKQNGTFEEISSKGEKYFKNILIENFNFNSNDILEQELLKGNKDYYIKSLDLYVEIDGEYWHGFNKTLKEIEKIQTPHSNGRIATYKRDQENWQFFAKENKNILRLITEKVEKCYKHKDYDYIIEELETYKSKNLLYNELINEFGEHNIIRRYHINGWLMDFVIKNHDIYVNVNNEEWYGVNKDINDIVNKNIINNINEDKQKQIWFKENHLSLVIITDIEILEAEKNKNYDHLLERIKNPC